jgi:hypothetical protein
MTEQTEVELQRGESPVYSCQLGDDGIVRFSLLQKMDIDLKLAEAAVRSFQDVAAERPRPVLIHVGMAKSMAREARECFSKVRGPSAVAMVVSSPIARVIGTIFAGLLRESPYPARVFGTEEAALEWLKQYAKST